MRVALTQGPDQPQRVVLPGETQPHEDDQPGAPDPPHGREALVGRTRLGEDLHIRQVADQLPQAGAHDGQRIHDHHTQTRSHVLPAPRLR